MTKIPYTLGVSPQISKPALPSATQFDKPTSTGNTRISQLSTRQLYKVKSENYDQSFPYMFFIANADPKTGEVSYKSENKDFARFKFTVNPTAIAISIPFAINTTATTRGILEEHNGVVFRTIQIAGTFGFTPGTMRVGGFQITKAQGLVGNLFPTVSNAIGSTIGAIKNVAADIKSLTSSGNTKGALDLSQIDDFGYVKLHSLKNYLVAYAEYKKDPANSAARLVFLNFKDNTAYVVTPLAIDCSKSKDSPHTYAYRITLKAWDLMTDFSQFSQNANWNAFFNARFAFSPNDAIKTIRDARSVIANAQNAIRAVTSDFENLYNIIGETMLAVKDVGNLGHTLADFPFMAKDKWNQIAKDFSSKVDAIEEAYTTSGDTQTTQYDKNISNSLSQLAPVANAVINEADSVNATDTPISNQTAYQQSQTQMKTDIKNPFGTTKDVITYSDFLDTYSINLLSLTSADQEFISTKLDKITNFSIHDFDERRAQIEAVRDAFSDYKGVGDATYNAAAERNTVTIVGVPTATATDFAVIKAFNDIIEVLDQLSSTNDYVVRNLPDPFIRAQDLASGTGIVIDSVRAALPIPFPFGGTLEGLAATYLGDPNKWLDIAILNQLKLPYIDEVGFIYNFTSAGSGNVFTVSSNVSLFLGQEIFLSSYTQREERRQIVRIDELTPTNFLITVDGDDDLSKYTVLQGARMKAFLPNTVNSSKTIFIPTNAPTGDSQPTTREIPATIDLGAQQRLMGVDLALTDNFDLAVGGDGDIKLSVGYANALQALRLKLGIEAGQLKQHQEYGSGLSIGQRLDMTAEELKQTLETAILGDPRFMSIPNINIEFEGSIIKTTISVEVANGSGVIPIQFKL